MTDKSKKPEAGKSRSAWTSPTAIAGAAIGSAAIAAALLYASRRKDKVARAEPDAPAQPDKTAETD